MFKRRVYFILLSLIPSLVGVSCNKETYHKVNKIFDYVYEVPTYTSLDYKYANEYYKNNFNNWDENRTTQGGGCSAIQKVIGGKNYVGRNLDLNISNKCAYVIRTAVPGKHKTVGLTYTFRDISPDLEKLKKDGGVDDKFYKMLPFMCDDIYNDAGLYIELNMRTGEYTTDGGDKFACKGTNPNAPKTVYMTELIRYVAENCSSVNEAEKYIRNNLNVYSKKYYWNYCFLLADKDNNSALLEFGHHPYRDQDVISFDRFSHCQTNFYVNEELQYFEEVIAGKGRYDYLQDHIDEVQTETDLFKLMKDISYSEVYKGRECNFDPRGECIGALAYATKKFVFDDKNYDFILDSIEAAAEEINKLSRKEKQDLNSLWESSLTEVVNVTDGYFKIRCFEDDNQMMKVTLDNTQVGNI